MEFINLLIYTAIIAIIWYKIGQSDGRSTMYVKDKPSRPKPNIEPTPQSPKRNKQGRTPDEQAFHEWMEDNPR